MNRVLFTATVALFILGAFVAGTTYCQAAEKVPLADVVILTDPDQPSYVQYAVQELAGYLKEITGQEAAVASTPDRKAGTVVVAGTAAAEKVLGGPLPAEKLGEEGYVLKSLIKDGVSYVIAAGATPKGTKYALGSLMKRTQADGRSAFVQRPLDVLSKPAFAKRGLHFNGWSFNYPYTFQRWREEDWQRYLDILAYEGVNLFYIWPFMEIMPLPLSAEDRASLEERRRVVDYAQKKHGMEVWIMQCTNRVAKDNCGVVQPKLRPYWLGFRRLNDPKGDTGTFLIVMLEDEPKALAATEKMKEFGLHNVFRIANYGLHIYYNIPSLVNKIPLSPAGNPWQLAENAESIYNYEKGSCPKSDMLFGRSILVPIPSRLTEDQERAAADAIRAAVTEQT